jgi:hypothetical protein
MMVNDVTNPGGIGPVKGITPRQTEALKPLSTPTAGAAPLVDRPEVTRDVQAEARLLQGAKLVADALPNIREDKVALAKARLAAGYYDRPEVKGEIIVRLLADPEASPPPHDPLSEERAAELRGKIATPFYEQPVIRDKVVAGLIDDAS